MIIVLLIAGVLNSTKAATQLNLQRSIDTVERKILLKPLPQNFYNQNLGYFCKKENQIQKFTSLSLFVRLGSKEHVDYLESKPNAIKRN